MTDATANGVPAARPGRHSASLFELDARTRRRNAAERRFRMLGLGATGIGVAALILLLISILGQGLPAFTQTFVSVPVYLDPAKLDKTGERNIGDIKKVSTFGYAPLIAAAMDIAMERNGIDPAQFGLGDKDAQEMVSKEAAAQIRNYVIANPDRIGETVDFRLLTDARIDGYYKGRVSMESAELDSNVSPGQLRLADALKEKGVIATGFNPGFITNADASENRPEAAGMGVAIIGSFYMMIIVLCLALPIGVAASIYLEEFAPKNWFTDLIEVNISNLAAVPSIVFGILGLAIFINWMGLPQSAPIVGGLVLTLMTLPTIIISTRASLKSVPPSIRDAALGLGASKMQSVFHHVLPLAMPGILTGT
ncbi:PstA family ABC transporter permease, partial [Tropicimonas sp.]|uniref:PstA family ABC transporter permease n=1 Tax=Tropicimonas sp. TaxID=2067044 RepID=UPI003A884A4C